MVFIVDNGAFNAKIGYSHENEPKVMPNSIMKAKSERRRPFIGNQIEECRDISGLYYILSFQKGYLTNWDIQKTVWDHILKTSKSEDSVNFSDTPCIVTEPISNFSTLKDAMLEIFFEEYDCMSLLSPTAPELAAANYANAQAKQKSSKKPLCCVVVDSGYSFTHIVCFIRGVMVKDAVRRIDIGGKLLTNHLKDVISYRQLNVMDESYVINQVKEDSCFVAENFNEAMQETRKRYPENKIVRDYFLPDFTSLRRGYLSEPDTQKRQQGDYQALKLNNERICVPELLFNPSDVGIQQMGIAEAILDAVQACPEETHHHLLSNVILCGGNALFAGIKERLYKDLRALAAEEHPVNVTVADNPISYAWQGGKLLTKSMDTYGPSFIKRQEYEEFGNKILDQTAERRTLTLF